MSTLSPQGRALIRAGQRAFRPTAEDRARLLGALRTQLGDSALLPDMSSLTAAVSVGRTIWPPVSVAVVGVGIIGRALFYARYQRTGPAIPQIADGG
jgi:hypothetical protein